MRPVDPFAAPMPMPRPRRRRTHLAWLLLALAIPAWAQPPVWTLDPVHTRVLVTVDHAGFSSALGTLSGATGTVHYEPGDWTGARVEVEIPLQRLDFGDDAWNRATLARGLLDADAHPVALFRSTRVEPIDEHHARVTGQLQLRGVEREVVLEVRMNAARRHPLPPFRRTVGFSASAALSRSDFGIDAWRSMIGDRVELRIEAEATRSRGAARDAAPANVDADADKNRDADTDIDAGDADAGHNRDDSDGERHGEREAEATTPLPADSALDAGARDLHEAAAAAAGIEADADSARRGASGPVPDRESRPAPRRNRDTDSTPEPPPAPLPPEPAP